MQLAPAVQLEAAALSCSELLLLLVLLECSCLLLFSSLLQFFPAVSCAKSEDSCNAPAQDTSGSTAPAVIRYISGLAFEVIDLGVKTQHFEVLIEEINTQD